MAAKLASEAGRALDRLRQPTVEPIFGVIKAVLGFKFTRVRAGADQAIEIV